MDARLRSSLEAELSCRYIPTRKQYQRRGLPMCREGISKRPLPENSRRSRLGSGERSGLEEEEDRRRCLLLLPDHQHPARTLALLLSSRTAVFFFCKTLLTTARNNMESAA
ncbi:uncharacterized protein LOC121928691 isoform X3 [Sceloporus undulatus]|uniref:uncharacterized protein LOC121928691 isoform X3 n=1 Tax=Sceloporus undulatus TaxID=8520 RepID=UPI001C4A893B|nr:uncharacterized protein LOC121928691 isoform X3 [Sceloporus undulatus]